MSNISGMFQQFNNTLDNLPSARRYDESIPGMTPSPLDKTNPLIRNMIRSGAGALGVGGDYLSSPEKAAVSNEQMGTAVKSQDPKALMAAGQLLMSQGRTQEAIQLITMGREAQAAQNATLQAGADANLERAKQARLRQQQTQAMQLAKNKGDTVALKALENKSMSGQDYFKAQMAAKDSEGFTLADGAERFDKDGKMIARNPKDPKESKGSGGSKDDFAGPMSATLTKIDAEITKNAYEKSNLAVRANDIANKLEALPPSSGGARLSLEEFIKLQAGTQGEQEELRRQVYGIRNAQVVENLPPGAASDPDVAMAKEGFPPNGATNAQLVQLMRGTAKMAKMDADFNTFRSNYMASKREQVGVHKAWKMQNTPVAVEEMYKDKVQALKKAGKTKEAEAEEYNFMEFFGWNPLKEDRITIDGY